MFEKLFALHTYICIHTCKEINSLHWTKLKIYVYGESMDAMLLVIDGRHMEVDHY
jgi:hypothetical protein